MTYPEETLAATGDPYAEEPGRLPHEPGGVAHEPGGVPHEPGQLPHEPGQLPQEHSHGPGQLPHEPIRISVAIREMPEATVVAVGGELDLLTAPQLAAELEPILTAEARPIAIDLTDTTFMDSAGIHVLVNISNQAPRHFAVICPDGTVRRTIELVGLAEPLCVVDSFDEYLRRRAGG